MLIHTCVRACVHVCVLHLMSVFMSLCKDRGTTGNQPPCFTSGVDIGPDTELFCRLHVAQEDAGAAQSPFYSNARRSVHLRVCSTGTSASFVDPRLPWLQPKEDSMQLAVKRFARFYIRGKIK